MKVYKAHIVYTKQRDRFEVVENGYVAVDDNGQVCAVADNLDAIGCPDAEVVDFGNRLLIPAMNDVHVHAAQYHNQGMAMDLELLPWLDNYTFPENQDLAMPIMPSVSTAVLCTTSGGWAPCVPPSSPPFIPRAPAA